MFEKKLKSVGLALAVVLSQCWWSHGIAAQAAPASDLVLVLPFENTSNFPEYNWVGESFADSLAALLNKPGLQVISSDERALAFQRLRLPLTVLPSRATAIKLAREAKATMIVVGTYSVTPPQEQQSDKQSKNNDDKTIMPASVIGEARVVKVNEGRTIGDVFEGSWAPRVYDFGGAIATLQTMQGRLAYQILSQRDKSLPFSQNNLIEEATKIPPLAFEAYVKGVQTSTLDPKREVYLKNAMHLYAKENEKAVYPRAAFELGQFYVAAKKWKEAAEYLTMLQKKDPHYGEAQFYTGLAYWRLGDLSRALAALVPLASDMPLVGVYNNAGAAAVQAAREEKKAEDHARLLAQGVGLLARAAESSPDDPMVQFNYGYGLFLSGKNAEAAEQLQKVIAMDPRDGQAYFILAKALERTSRTEAATAADNQARRNLQTAYAKWQTEWQKSQTTPALSLRVREILNQDDISDLQRRMAANAEAARAASTQDMLAKARELYQAGRDDEALPEIARVLMFEPTNAEAFLLSGRINQRRGEQESAIAALRSAIFWDSHLIDAHILLGKIFLERGDRGEAVKYASSAINIDPNNQEAIALQRQVTMGRQ
jgi:tetratricopeptide (TPR) repeat protein